MQESNSLKADGKLIYAAWLSRPFPAFHAFNGKYEGLHRIISHCPLEKEHCLRLTYIVNSLRLVCNLPIATLSESLMHLRSPSRPCSLDQLCIWVHWLLDLGIAEGVPILACASVSILAILVLQLVLILVDLHLLLVLDGVLLVPYVVLWVANYN